MSTTTVHILAAVRKPELLRAALMVFRTLRIGFPSARIEVWGNGLDGASSEAVANAAFYSQANYANTVPTTHDAWIEKLVGHGAEPFWLCDTDVIFWQSMERFTFHGPCAGRFEPSFEEESTGTLHVERLHPSLMWVNPPQLRAGMRGWMARIPPIWAKSAEFPFIRQCFIPDRRGRTRFYDTCAGIWQAGIGEAFVGAVDDSFEHMHCATYIDLVAKKLSTDLARAHEAIYADHHVAKGMRHSQAAYYAKLKPKETL